MTNNRDIPGDLTDPIRFMLYLKRNKIFLNDACHAGIERAFRGEEYTSYHNARTVSYGQSRPPFEINNMTYTLEISTSFLIAAIRETNNVLAEAIFKPIVEKEISERRLQWSMSTVPVFDNAYDYSIIDIHQHGELNSRINQHQRNIMFRIDQFYGMNYLNLILERHIVKILIPKLEQARDDLINSHYKTNLYTRYKW